MRHSFFLHVALGLLSWSSQLVDASTETHLVPGQRSDHLPRSESRPHPLALPSTRTTAKDINAER